MSAVDAGFSSNGRGSGTWSRSWTHMGIDRRSTGYCRVTFDHPPINRITATTVAELAEIVDLIELDPDLNVVVFDSANPEHYLGEHDGERPAAWTDVLVRLARAPVVSIAAIRGRAGGGGTELLLACDLRFASRETTLLGRFEGRIGGAATARLSRLAGRGRALELLLVTDECDGPRAELYGYVNRLVADRRLDGEVEAIALRLARLDHAAIARTKSALDDD